MIGWDWDKDLTPEERDALIDKLAKQIVAREMQTVAIMFLEMHRPFSFLAGQSLLVGSGFLAPLFGPQNIRSFSKLLEDRANIDRLIQRIETLELESKTKKVSQPKTD